MDRHRQLLPRHPRPAHSPEVSSRPVAARFSLYADPDTYGCVSGPTGALEPGPRLTLTIQRDPTAWEDVPSDLATEDAKFWVGGLKVNPSAVYGGIGNPDRSSDQNNAEVHFGFEYYTSATGSTANASIRKLEKYRRNYSDPAQRWVTILTETVTGVADPHVTTMPRRCFMQSTRSNPSDPDVVGPPVMAYCYDGDDTCVVYPDPTAHTTESTSGYPHPGVGLADTSVIFAHQGRIVGCVLTLWGAGANQLTVNTESLYWTEVNDHSTHDADLENSFTDVIAGWENPTGYVDGASLAHNEILLFKAKGGALLLRGDLDDPRIIPLPNVMSPGLHWSWGVATPIGFAYVVHGSGLWLWSGDDASEFLTPHMTADFWRPLNDRNGTQLTGSNYWHHSSMALWNEWIVLPGSYLYDWQRKAIWRYHPDDLFFNDTEVNGRWLYSSVARFDHEDGTVAYEFDKKKGAAFYRYTSTPMPISAMRQSNIDEMIVVASGIGDIDLTVFSSEDTNGRTRSVRVNSTKPRAYRLGALHARGTHLQFQLNVTGNTTPGSEVDAPTVYEVHVGAQESMQLAEGSST